MQLLPQAVKTYEEALNLPDRLKGEKLVFRATLRPEFLANSYFPVDLLKAVSATAIGSIPARGTRQATQTRLEISDADTKTVLASGDAESLAALIEVLEHPESSAVSERVRLNIQAIERIELAHPKYAGPPNEASTGQLETWEAVLHPQAGKSGAADYASEVTQQRWFELIASLGGSHVQDWIRQSGGLTYVPVRLDQESVEEALQFNGLRQLSPMPRPRHAETVVELPESILLPVPMSLVETSRPLRVAVFDGGVDAASPYWAGRVREIPLGHILPDSRADDHGSLVTSALLYGPDPKNPLMPANMTIDHYRVWPQVNQNSFEMYWLLDMIKERVAENDYQVVVISTAPERFAESDIVDRWTHELDQLSHERNVLFVSAAGNNGEQSSETGQDGILLPGDMVNGMAVGASSSRSPRPRRAIFSAKGPGRVGGRVRPDGIAFGGTDQVGFNFVRNNGTVASMAGTSASAPHVVHGMADLAQRLGPRRVNPVSLRAFNAHFALPVAARLPVTEVGHGALREDWEFISDDEGQIAHVLFEGVISRDEFIPLLLPVPDAATSSSISLRYTLATSTAVDPKDPVEYTKAGLTIRIRPDARKFVFSKKNAKTYNLHLVRDKALIAQLTANGWTAATDPVSMSLGYRGNTETVLREEGKWDTLRTFSRKFQTGNVYRPRVELSHLAREDGRLTNNAPDLSWALLVTLEGPKDVAMHDLVRSQFPILTPLPVPAARVTTQP
ncbi:S8 family serine peptidase [Arthrobacter sp. Soil762]|uniref:S8 family serine peptidase n=1 Tax=Arthrobacter sp. Soil762 TaxID=1736401 RepID=UPI0009EBC86F|nr:S8 family serine peptidase [Arthrobacter sp. Soil762]